MGSPQDDDQELVYKVSQELIDTKTRINDSLAALQLKHSYALLHIFCHEQLNNKERHYNK
jgi:hypothetical protein